MPAPRIPDDDCFQRAQMLLHRATVGNMSVILVIVARKAYESVTRESACNAMINIIFLQLIRFNLEPVDRPLLRCIRNLSHHTVAEARSAGPSR